MAWGWRLSSVTFRCCAQNDSTYHHSVFTTWKWHPFATCMDAKFHHPSLGASPPNRGNRICLPPWRTLVKRRTVNNSGIGILCSKNSNGRLAIPAVAGLLVSDSRNGSCEVNATQNSATCVHMWAYLKNWSKLKRLLFKGAFSLRLIIRH